LPLTALFMISCALAVGSIAGCKGIPKLAARVLSGRVLSELLELPLRSSPRCCAVSSSVCNKITCLAIYCMVVQASGMFTTADTSKAIRSDREKGPPRERSSSTAACVARRLLDSIACDRYLPLERARADSHGATPACLGQLQGKPSTAALKNLTRQPLHKHCRVNVPCG
jgi:hypothetical protein